MEWIIDGTEVRVITDHSGKPYRLAIYRKDGITVNAFETHDRIFVMEGFVDFEADDIITIDKANGTMNVAATDSAFLPRIMDLIHAHYKPDFIDETVST